MNAVYFRVRADCMFRDCGTDAALYDVTGRRVFLFDDVATSILRQCEANSAIDRSTMTEAAWQMLTQLATEGVGTFESAPVYVDGFELENPGAQTISLNPYGRELPLKTVDYSITGQCDLTCAVCPLKDGRLSRRACTTCVRRSDTGERPELLRDPARLADELADMGVLLLHVRGGNPLLDPARLHALLSAARRRELPVVVTTPGTGQSIATILEVAEYPHVTLNIVLFGTDRMSTVQFSGADIFDCQIRLLDELQRKAARFTVSFIVNNDIYPRRHALQSMIWRRWKKRAAWAEIADRCEGGRQLSPRELRVSKWVSPVEFNYRKHYNPCLAFRCSIDVDGAVYPCPGMNRSCGRIEGKEVQTGLLSDALGTWWEITGGDLTPCTYCVMQPACVECFSPAQENLEHELCPFNPRGEVPAWRTRWVPADFVSVVRVSGTGHE